MSRQRTLKDWFVACRPWSFPASFMPVIATLAYLFLQSRIDERVFPFPVYYDWINGILSLVMIIILHAGGNLVSDYYDHIRHVDLPRSRNGVNWMTSGLFKPREILYYGLTLLAAGASIGLVILSRSSFDALWIGVLAVALPLAYPWLKSIALGDLDILLSFAIVPAYGVCFVVTREYINEILLLCLPYGLLTVSILHANNFRDRENDRRAGLCTLPLLIGEKASCCLYGIEVLLPYILVLGIALFGMLELFSYVVLLIVFISLPMAWRNFDIMCEVDPIGDGDISRLDQFSAKLQLVFGLLYTVGFVIIGLIMV